MNQQSKATMKILPPEKVTVLVEPGKYYLGDPCYCFSSATNTWNSICSKLEDSSSPVIDIKGDCILAFSTKYGDGEYFDQHGNSYPVDSGLLGLVPYDFIEKDSSYDKHRSIGRIIDFAFPKKCVYNENGLLRFGNIEIETGEEGDE